MMKRGFSLISKACKLEQGFSLIELLVVLSIIAVISGISMFALNDVRISSRDAKRKADLETIRSAIEIYKSDCGSYPLNVPSSGTTLAGPAGSTCVGNTYMQTVPTEPTGGNYVYRRISNTTYEICTRLEQGTGTQSCGNPPTSTCASGTCNFKVTNP